MTDLEQRAHDLAMFALRVSYEKCKRQEELEGEPIAFDMYNEYFKHYQSALYAVSKTQHRLEQ